MGIKCSTLGKNKKESDIYFYSTLSWEHSSASIFPDYDVYVMPASQLNPYDPPRLGNALIPPRNALILCLDENDASSSSSGARKYNAFFMKNGYCVRTEGTRTLKKIPLGNLILSSPEESIKLIKSVLTRSGFSAIRAATWAEKNPYFPRLSSLLREKMESNDNEVWHQLCKFYDKEQQIQRSSFIGSQSSDQNDYPSIARHYSAEIESKKEEGSNYFNEQFFGKEFSADGKFGKLLKMYLTCYPKHLNYFNSGIVANLKITPHMPFGKKEIASAISELILHFSASDVRIIKAAALALAAIGAQLSDENQLTVMTALRARLRDSDWSVREGTLLALVAIAPQLSDENKLSAMIALIGCLSNPWRKVRNKAALAFAALAPQLLDENKLIIATALIAQLSCPERDVIVPATSALAAIAPQLSDENKLIAMIALARFADPHKDVSHAATWMLVALVPQLSEENKHTAVTALIAQLSCPEWDVIYPAASALAAIAPQLSDENKHTAMTAIIARFAEPDPFIKGIVAEALFTLLPQLSDEDKRTAVPSLIAWLENDPSGMYDMKIIAITRALNRSQLSGENKLIVQTRLIASLADHQDESAQQADVLALAALVTLLPQLSDEDKLTAVTALTTRCAEPAWFLPLTREGGATLAALAPHLSDENKLTAITAMIARFADPDEYVRVVAVEVLAALAPYLSNEDKLTAVTALITRFADPDGMVIHRAASALAALAPQLSDENKLTAVTSLRALLTAPNWTVRMGAARALGDLASQLSDENKLTTMTTLIALFADPEEDVRMAVAEALKNYLSSTPKNQHGSFFKIAIPLLFNTLKQNPSIHTRLAIAEFVSELMSKMNENQKNYVTYGVMFNEFAEVKEKNNYSSALLEIMVRICSERALAFSQKEIILKATLLPDELVEVVTQYIPVKR